MTGQPRNEAEALQRALARHGIFVPDHCAREAVEAVLSHADRVVSTAAALDVQQWKEPACREYTRQQLRHELLDEVTSAGLVPVTLPHESVQDPDPARPFDMLVKVKLTVPVRMPPVDRKAAVKARILGG